MNEKDILVLTLKNVYYANSLRRAMISDVPTLAIDNVNIEINESNLHDEMLCHRLSLVVLDSSDCSKEFEIFLDIICHDDNLDVTSDLLKSDLNIMKGILIVKLHKGERIKLSAIARKGTGREHAKWSPVSAIGYFTYQKSNDEMEIKMCIESVGSLKSEEILEQAKSFVGKVQKDCLNKFKRGYEEECFNMVKEYSTIEEKNV